MIPFCNSGNEANKFAIVTALAFNQRQKVMVFEGGYHGGSLMFPATPRRLKIPQRFLIRRYNDIERTRERLEEDIGVILVEPMQGAVGSIFGTKEFLTFLRQEATRIRAVVIFDEVITSRLYILWRTSKP
jgi:glutamate-1-semialdehyde 2,1-aminomutase